MNKSLSLKFRIVFTAIITFLLISLLIYQYFSEGIPGHHFLANKNYPLISNAWGGISIPLFTWIMLWRIEKRIFNKSTIINFPREVIAGFFCSLLFGIVLGISIQLGIKEISRNALWVILGAAIIFPTYRAECFLGFVLGLTYWVGGILPIVVGGVFLILSFIIYKYFRGSLIWVWNRWMSNSPRGNIN